MFCFIHSTCLSKFMYHCSVSITPPKGVKYEASIKIFAALNPQAKFLLVLFALLPVINKSIVFIVTEFSKIIIMVRLGDIII